MVSSGLRAVPRSYAQWLVRWRWLVLILSLTGALAMAAFAVRQHYYNPYDVWFHPDDPALREYRDFVRQYGEEDLVVIAFRDEDGIFANKALAAILDLTERLEATRLIEKVTSLTNYQYIRGGRGQDQDTIVIDDLIRREELPLGVEELRERQRIAMSQAPIRGSLLPSEEPADTTAVVVRVKAAGEHPGRVVEDIKGVVHDVETTHGYRMYLAGVPVVEHAFETFGRRETITFTCALLAVVVVLLAVVFRTPPGVILPCAVVLLAVGSALGIMALLGIWLNPLTTIIPQILITVAIAETIHIVASYMGVREQGLGRHAAVVAAIEENFLPCLLTSATTAIAFASLVMGSLVPMRELGIGATIGTLVAFALTFTFLPTALAVFPERMTRRWWEGQPHARASTAGLRPVIQAMGELSVRRPRAVIVAVAAVFASIVAFAAWLEVETAYQNMFKPETELRRGLAFIEQHLGGSEDVEISLDSGRPDGVKDPAFLAKIATIQEFVASLPAVTQTFSIVDILKRMNKVMHDEAPGTATLPDTSDLAAQYLLLYTLGARNEDLKDRIDVNNQSTRLTARARVQSARDTQAMGRQIRAFIAARFPELTAVVTSRALLYTTMQEDLAASTLMSFLTAFIPITIMLGVVFLSVRLALLSAVPNLLPIAAMVGLMGLFRIPLDPGSAMVASVAIGIVVDDTVHFFSRYIGCRRSGLSPENSVRSTLEEVGRPVVYTSVILACGFSLFSLSQFNFIAYFGQLAATVIVLALLADLLLTPALLVLYAGKPGLVRRDLVPGHPVKLALILALPALMIANSPVSTAFAASADERGLQIMREQEQINRGYGSEVAHLRMTLIDAKQNRSERDLELRTLEGSGSEGDKTLIVFKAPPDIAGTALLTHQQRTGDDDQWLYLPALKRIRRIASSNRSSSFVGSEFSYEDLISLDVAKYRFRYLRDDNVDGVAAWIVEAVPAFKDSGYSRLHLAVQQNNYQTIRTVFFDKRGEMLKTRYFEAQARPGGRWWRARIVRMENAQTGKSTVLETLSIRLPAGLSARDFTTRALER